MKFKSEPVTEKDAAEKSKWQYPYSCDLDNKDSSDESMAEMPDGTYYVSREENGAHFDFIKENDFTEFQTMTRIKHDTGEDYF